MLLINLIILLFTILHLRYRYKKQLNVSNTRGFVLNPLMHYVIFSLLYMLLANILALNGAYGILGFSRFEDTLSLTAPKVTAFYLMGWVFYLASEDKKIKGDLTINRISKDYSKILLVLNVLLVVLMIYILTTNFISIYSLKSDRALAYELYNANVVNKFRYTLLVNYIIAITFFTMLFDRNVLNKYLSVFLIFLVLLMDFSHGGRALSLKIAIATYMVIVIKTNKSYFIFAFLFTIFLIVSALLVRIPQGLNEFLPVVYNATAELVLTRVTTDVVVFYDISRGFHEPILAFAFTIFPNALSEILNIKSVFLGREIMDHLNIDLGLASNLVTESIVYFGDYYILSAVLIGAALYALNAKLFMKNSVLLFILIFYICNIQDMNRTSFYDLGLDGIYIACTYLALLTVLFFNKRIFSKTRETLHITR